MFKLKSVTTAIYERAADDWYVEPKEATSAFLRRVQPPGPIFDPCCGQGNIPAAAGEIFGPYNAIGADLHRRFDAAPASWRWRGCRNFLAEALDGGGGLDLPALLPPDPFGSIVMNPPYVGGLGTEAFIRRGIELCDFVACFAPARFLFGSGRARGLYAEHRPSAIYILAPRPSCPPGQLLRDGTVKASGGKEDYAWIVFDQRMGPPRETKIDWLIWR